VLDRDGITVLAGRVEDGSAWVAVGRVQYCDDDGAQAMRVIEACVHQLTTLHGAWAMGAKGTLAELSDLCPSPDGMAAAIGRIYHYAREGRPAALRVVWALIKNNGCSLTAGEIDAVVAELDPTPGS